MKYWVYLLLLTILEYQKNIILYYTIVTQIMSLYSILIDINKKKGNYAGDHYHWKIMLDHTTFSI